MNCRVDEKNKYSGTMNVEKFRAGKNGVVSYLKQSDRNVVFHDDIALGSVPGQTGQQGMDFY